MQEVNIKKARTAVNRTSLLLFLYISFLTQRLFLKLCATTKTYMSVCFSLVTKVGNNFEFSKCSLRYFLKFYLFHEFQ